MSKLNNNTGSIERRVRHILCAIVTLMKKQLRLIKQSDLQPLNPLLSHSCRMSTMLTRDGWTSARQGQRGLEQTSDAWSVCLYKT